MIINAFNNIPSKPLPQPEGVAGMGNLTNTAAIQIGTGIRSFKGDSSGIWLGANTFANAPFSVDMQGNLIASSATLTGMGKNFVSTIAWTATDEDTATWASGTIKTSDGTSYSISSGNTGNIAALTYVYLDPATSITVLQTTTTATTAVGSGKVLIAIVQEGAASSKCIIDVIGSHGTTIDGDRIITGIIASADGFTYFDLDLGRLVINDDTTNRGVFGDV